MELLATGLNIATGPPVHVLDTLGVLALEEIVTHPAGDWEEWDLLLNHVLLPAYRDQHAAHLVGDLLVTGLLVAGSVAIHLVAANGDLLDTQQVDEARVLAGLALDLTGLVVALGDGSGEVTIARNHDEGNICPH